MSEQISAREKEVCALVAQGLFNTEIADRLGVTEATVKQHLSNIMRKLGLRNRVEVAIAFLETNKVPK